MRRRPVAPRTVAGFLIILILPLIFASCGGGNRSAPPSLPFTANSEVSWTTPEVDQYRIMVYDELTLTVLGAPELSGPLRVLPDGTVTVPGIGNLYVLGMTPQEVDDKISEMLSTIVRYPQASVAVTNFGQRRIFVMGEVGIPGDHEFHRGMTTLSAIAQAGGFNDRAKRSSVVILRRLGPDQAVAISADLRDPLRGKHLEKDLQVRPFDVIYVPKTFIASVDVLMDQYFRQLTPPFTLYLEGWNAFHIDETNIRFIAQ
ncbi:MAG: polysaccharide biosynthesis/export family protein [Candidatus Eisenbacteria bacterium]|nr:polysaccharide biosynthesis/export family protein [Candidatus Eisenbacteria bacterium]